MSWTVLIPDRLPAPADVEQRVLGADARVVLAQAGDGAGIADGVWRNADAIIAWHEVRLDAAVINCLDRCRVIVRCGVGYDNVDLEAAGSRGILVCNVPDYGTNDVADHTLALMLTLARGLPAFSEKARASNQHWHWSAAGTLHRLTGATFGIVGFGRIGMAAAVRAKAFGMRVAFYDPYKPDGYDKAVGADRVETLAGLLEQSDVLSLHVPLTEETRGMIDAGALRRLKLGAMLINTSRGGVADLTAIGHALRSGRLVAAGLDVLDTEPPDDAHPLIAAWRAGEDWLRYRLLITPHAAMICEESYREVREKAALEVRRVLSGESPRNSVNQEWLRSLIT